MVLKNEEDVTKNVSISLKNNKKWSVIEDNLYVELANIVSLIVFHNDIESVRYNLNML